MYYSFKGTIVSIGKDRIALDLGSIAYELLVARPSDFTLGQNALVYVYEVYGENDHYLVGFADKREKEAFLSLIEVKGIGPKTALTALGASNPTDLFRAIAANNTSYLKKLPGIGPKAAAQIILDLKGKLTETDQKGNPERYGEVHDALKALGFKNKEIDDVLSSINEPGLSEQEVMRMALRKLRGGKR